MKRSVFVLLPILLLNFDVSTGAPCHNNVQPVFSTETTIGDRCTPPVSAPAPDTFSIRFNRPEPRIMPASRAVSYELYIRTNGLQ
ncbi:MAG TPA: hypothetical protein VD996_09315 [Chitinophagaceae bacterium]|nr:hypothetical protein [Chitinophagaceae bacterium]